MKGPLTEGKTLGGMCPKITTGRPKRPIGPPPAPKPKIPAEHKQIMDQTVEAYRKGIEEMFADVSNRGPKYDPTKLPHTIAEFSICDVQLTLDDEWDPKYEEYIKEIANVLNKREIFNCPYHDKRGRY